MAPPVSNGQPDSYFVAEVRRILRDQIIWNNESPSADGSSGALGVAASKPLRLQRAPIARTLFQLTAPAPASSPGFTAWVPHFDIPQPDTPNYVVPQILDAGATNNFAAGNYQVALTLVTAAGEFGLTPASNLLTIAVNHGIRIPPILGFSPGVTNLRAYVVSSTGSNVGFLGTVTVTNGASADSSFSTPPSNGQLPCLIVTDTGELFFPTAPASGSIPLQYQVSRYSDQQIVDALIEGVDMLWPEVWNPAPFDTSSIQPSPVQYEYALPAAFQDQRAVLMDVETRPPQAWVRFERKSGWRVVNDVANPTLVFHRPPPVGGQVRLTYAVPIATLAGVPSIAQFLPVYYAVARLLADQEVMRSRADDLPALTGENAGGQPGSSTQTSAWYMQNMFAPALAKLSLGPPARRTMMDRAVERLGLSETWQRMAS